MSKQVAELFSILLKETDLFKKAKLIRILYREKMIPLKEIAARMRKHPSYISHYLNLLRLPEIVLDGYYSKDITAAHLFILSRLKNEPEIVKAYETILAGGLTTAQTEEYIRELLFEVKPGGAKIPQKERNTLQGEIAQVFRGAEVKIIQTRIKGMITLQIKGNTEKTEAFIRSVTEKLTRKASPDIPEDDMQVLE